MPQWWEQNSASFLKRKHDGPDEGSVKMTCTDERIEEWTPSVDCSNRFEPLSGISSDTEDGMSLAHRLRKRTKKKSSARSMGSSSDSDIIQPTPQKKKTPRTSLGHISDSDIVQPTPQQVDPRLQTRKKVNKPPPIVIDDVADYMQFQNSIAQTTGGRFNAELRGRKIQLFTNTNEQHDNLIKALEVNEIPHHTYQKKENKKLSVIFRGIHPSISNEDIQKELEKYGYTINEVYRFSGEDGTPVPVISVTAPDSALSRSLLKLNVVCGFRVTPEIRKKLDLPVVCMKCAKFGHTSNYCKPKQLKCGFCGGNHTPDQHPKSTPYQCPNCHGDHAANSQACPARLNQQEKIETRREANKIEQEMMRMSRGPRENVWTERQRQKMTETQNNNERTNNNNNDKNNNKTNNIFGGLLSGITTQIKGIMQELAAQIKTAVQDLVQSLVRELRDAFSGSFTATP